MGEILTTMMRPNDVTASAGHAAERIASPRRVRADVLFDQRPGGFDGIEIVRVGRQKLHRRPAAFDDRADRWRFVGLQIIEHDDIAAPQMRCETAPDPLNERLGVERAPFGAQREPPLLPHRADQRQVVAPVHRTCFQIFLAALDPHVRSAHGDVRPRFIDKNQAAWVSPPHPFQERRSLRCHVRPVAFAWPRAFFLSTNPVRCIARPKLVGVVRCSRATRRLYSQHNSAIVPSGASRTTVTNIFMSIGECQPPRFGSAATDPVSRALATHRWSVRHPMPNRDARSWYPARPVWYAATARSRSAISYGSAMATLKYTFPVNSSAFWD